MNFHEYQAKELFAQFGIPVPQGTVANTPMQQSKPHARSAAISG